MAASRLPDFEGLLKLFFRAVIPLAMLVFGVILMISRLSGWNLIIGTPIVVLGTVFLIYTYNEVINKTAIPLSQEFTRCLVCGHLTPRVNGILPEETICFECKKTISKKL